MLSRTTRRIAAASMAAAAALAIAGFTALGSIFDYPGILQAPTAEILTAYRNHQSAITGWFLALVIGAALIAPAGVLLGRVAGGRRGRWIAAIGVAAAAVQVIGLSRWVLLVPGVSRAAVDPTRSAGARHTFERLHFWLGTILGETVGYALTAVFTLLVVTATRGMVLPRWTAWLGGTAAVLIATGVTVPLGLHAATVTNFVGYLAWCGWLVATAAILWRPPSTRIIDGGGPRRGRGRLAVAGRSN